MEENPRINLILSLIDSGFLNNEEGLDMLNWHGYSIYYRMQFIYIELEKLENEI